MFVRSLRVTVQHVTRLPRAFLLPSRGAAHPESDVLSPQQKFVRCSVRAEVRHLRRVLCHRLNVEKQQVGHSSRPKASWETLRVVASGDEWRLFVSPQVQMLFNNESLPDHMTMKRLWLSHWFGKVRSRHTRRLEKLDQVRWDCCWCFSILTFCSVTCWFYFVFFIYNFGFI